MRREKSLGLRGSLLVGLCAFLGAAVAATAATSGAETRVLLLTHRFTPATAPASSPLAEQLVAQRGETEGFQLITRATGSRLHARLGGSSDQFFSGRVRFLRVGFVRVQTPSTAVSLGAGTYADPLPRQTDAGLETDRGQWAGFVVLVDVPRDATPGAYSGEVELEDESGRVVATRTFALRVAELQTIPASDRRSFKAIGGFQTAFYLKAAPTGDAHRDAGAKLKRQYGNLLSFLSDHHMTPNYWDFGRPNRQGRYDDGSCGACWWKAPDYVRSYNAADLPAKLFPHRGDDFWIQRDWDSVGDTYLKNVWSYWNQRDWVDSNTYFYVWDEPGNKQEQNEIPAINRLVHRHAQGVKTFATTFPYTRTKSRKLCKSWGNRKCYVVPGRKNSNRNLWNGGADDLDVFAIVSQRYYGEYSRGIERFNGINHSKDTWNLTQKLRASGKEIWSYSYFLPNRALPQLVIDGPPTDPRLLFAWNAYEANRGWLIWQIARWIDGRAKGATGSARNPFDDTLSYQTHQGALANGDTSLFYPPVATRYGLHDPAEEPITSLRFETMRDGIEDVNLVTQYRERFGKAAARKAFSRIFGTVGPAAGAGYTWPKYDNAGLAERLEGLRRTLISALDPTVPARR